MYPKAILVTLVKDVIMSYKITVDSVTQRREADIAKILDICEVAVYDTMVIHSIREIIKTINHRSEGWVRWLYAPPSRLAGALNSAIIAYERSVRKQEKHTQRIKQHSLNIQHNIPSREVSVRLQPNLPTVKEIQRQVRELENKGSNMKMLMPS